MRTATVALKGIFFDGKAPVGWRAKLTVSRTGAVLEGDNVARSYATSELRVSPRIGNASRFIALPDGGQFHCEDKEILNWLPQEVRSEGPVAWLENRPAVAASCVLLIAAFLLVGYFIGLPAAAEHVAAKVPVETRKALDEEIIAWIDGHGWFEPAHIKKKQQDSIRQGFEELISGLSMEPHYQLEFRCSEIIGPNALALPGGTIIITDQMVDLAESEDEVLAVLAHEMGHVENNHVMRQILQSSAVGVTVAAITSDAASLGIAVAGLPVLLLRNSYSRDFETEADEFAFHLLQEHDISPEAFASLMERLDSKDIGLELGYLSTHPETSERVERAREQAGLTNTVDSGGE